MENTTKKPKTTPTNTAPTKCENTQGVDSLNAEFKLLQSKYQSLEESYKLKCEECDRYANAYRTAVLRTKAIATAVKTYTKAYNLSIELLLPNDGGEQ